MSSREPSPRFHETFGMTIRAHSIINLLAPRTALSQTQRRSDPSIPCQIPQPISRPVTPLHPSPSPSVGSIPSFVLPSPLAAPPLNSLSRSSAPRKIISTISRGDPDVPRSPGGSTIRPVRLVPQGYGDGTDGRIVGFAGPNSLGIDLLGAATPELEGRRVSEETTVKPTSLARHLNDYMFLLAELGNSTHGSMETAIPPRIVVGVDEVEVEWCALCGRERGRQSMELKEVRDDPSGGIVPAPVSGEEGRHHINTENLFKGMWWVCKDGCGTVLV